MAIKRIDSIYDVESIKAESKAVKDALVTSYNAIVDSYTKIEKLKTANTLTNVKDAIKETEKAAQTAAKATTELTTAQVKYEKATEQAAKTTAKATQNNQALVASAKAQSTALLGGTDSYAAFANSVEETIRQQLNLNLQLEDTKQKIKENDAAFNAGKTSLDAYKDKKIELVKLEKDLKLQTAELTKEINIQLKAEQGTSGSIEQLTNEYNALYVVFKKLSDAERQSEGGQELIKNLGQLKSNINEIQKQAGNFSANVGRYAESLSPAFKVLVDELSQIRTKLAGMNQGDAGFAKLAAEEKALTQITEHLGKTLGNVANLSPKTELRALENAAKSLGSQFGIASETFEKFATEVGSRKDQLQDVQNAINFKASDTRYLDGIVSAVNGIVGAYGAAQSAAVLFGDDNEALQKSMQKLQAILTLVTSLQAVQNAVQTDGAAIQTVLAAKTALLTAAKKAQAFFTGEIAAATQAEVIADGELSVAQGAVAATAAAEATALGAVAVANTEAAVSAGVTATAMEGEALAAGEATVATAGLSTALVATGIGAAIIAIVAGIVYLISKVNDWSKSDETAIKKQDELTEATVRLNKAIVDQAQFIKERNQAAVDFAQKELNLSKARGDNTSKQFALEKSLTDQQKKQQDAVVKKLGATEEAVDNSTHAYADALTQLKYYDQQEKKAIEDGKKDWVDYYKVRRESAEKTVSAEKENLDTISDALKTQTDIANHQQELQTTEATYNAAERRKVNLEYIRANAELSIDSNARILSAEKSSQAERIKALQATAAEQKKIAEAEANAVFSDPGSSAGDKTIAAKKLSADKIKIARDEQEQIFKINEDYRKRNEAAEDAAIKSKIDTDTKLQEALIGNQEQSLETRMNAVEKFITNQQLLLDEDYRVRKQQAGLTNAELYAIEVDYYTKTVALNADGQAKITAVISSEIDKQKNLQSEYVQFLQRIKDASDGEASGQYSRETIALNDALQKRTISQEDYQRKRRDLDFKYSQQILNQQIRFIKSQLESFKDEAEAEADLVNTIAALRGQVTTAATDEEKKRLADKIAILKKELDAIKENNDKKIKLQKELDEALKQQSEATHNNTQKDADDTFNSLVNAAQKFQSISNNISSSIGELASIGLDKQKVKLEELSAQQEKNYEAEVKRISALNISDAERADQLKILESQHQAQQEENERKLRKIQVERAKFEKAQNIASIITSTAVAVISALGAKPWTPLNIALAASVGVLGATQLARAIATPLPKFAKGVMSSPEGWAITDELGPEGYFKNGKLEIGSDKGPTLRYLDAGTRVIPNDELNRVMYATMMKDSIRPNIQKDNSIADAINFQTNKLVSAWKKNNSRKIVNNISVDTNWGTYLNQKVYNKN